MEVRISSLSPSGCFVDSRFLVPAIGEIVEEINIEPEPSQPLALKGIVTDSVPGIGFAVRFQELDEVTQGRLATLVRRRQAEQAPDSRPGGV